jgi:hypothetical protein
MNGIFVIRGTLTFSGSLSRLGNSGCRVNPFSWRVNPSG